MAISDIDMPTCLNLLKINNCGIFTVRWSEKDKTNPILNRLTLHIMGHMDWTSPKNRTSPKNLALDP